MTISAFDIYLVSLADKIVDPAGYIAIVIFVIFLFVASITLGVCDTQEEIKKAKSVLKLLCITMVVCGSLAVFIPSSKTIAAMYVLPAIVNNEHIQNSTGNALEALENLTKEWLKDTVKSKDSNPKEEHI